MKKVLLFSLCALAVVLVACGNKYVGEYEKLVASTTAKLDSVATIEQYNTVASEFAVATGDLQTQYGQDGLTQAETDKVNAAGASIAAKFAEIQAKVTPAPVVDSAAMDSTATVEVK